MATSSLGVTVGPEGIGVAAEQLAQDGILGERDPILVLADELRLTGVVTAVMKERSGSPLTVYAPSAEASDRPRRKVPVGDVAAGVPQDVEVVRERGSEVERALVDEQTHWVVDEAVVTQAPCPPAQQPVGAGGGRERHKAEVVRAGARLSAARSGSCHHLAAAR